MPRDFDETIQATLTRNPALGDLSKKARKWLTGTFAESPLSQVKNVLNGTLLEHPLHPVLTDIPIGAWTAAVALDIAAMVFGIRGLGKATGIAIGIGTLGAVGSLVSGLMDYTDTDAPEDATILTHGLVNLSATLLFAGSFLLRKQKNWRTEPVHVGLALLGYAAVTAGGFLGGSLVFRHGVMVNRNAFLNKTLSWTRSVTLDDLPENKPVRVSVQNEPVLLVRRGDQIFAFGAICSHYGAPLEQGTLYPNRIECPWHASQYALEDGRVCRGPTTAPIPGYQTEVRDRAIYVRRLAPESSPHTMLQKE